MTPRDCFGVVVRSVGLVLLLGILYQLLTGLWLAIGAGRALFGFSYLFYLLLCGVGGLVVSLYLLRGAPDLVRFCYPDPPRPPSSRPGS